MGKKSKVKDEVIDESIVEPEPEEGDKSKIEDASYADLLQYCQVFANPLASKKLTKKIYKVVKKASKAKHLSRGVRDVTKRIRKGDKGVVILAGDTFPADVISHLPVFCEEANIPYCYVPSKEYLGLASGSNRQACAMLVKEHAEYKDLYSQLFDMVKELPLPL